MQTMNGAQYSEMFEAILSLREAVLLGFDNVRSEFRGELRAEIGALDERWNRRFNALEARVETGFAEVTSSFVAAHVFAVVALFGCGGNPSALSVGSLQNSSLQNASLQKVIDERHSAAHLSTSSGDLLYVDNGGTNGCCAYVLVYSYPKIKHVATLTGFDRLIGECSDTNGDVFMVSPSEETSSPTTVYEYAHGGSNPIETLSEPGDGFGCAVDPMTGNLAVANDGDQTNPYNPGWGDVAVFAGAQGNPKMYYSATLEDFWYCGYDSKGNLYLSAGVSGGYMLASIAAESSSSIEEIKSKTEFFGAAYFAPSVQWDGKEMTVTSTLKQVETEKNTGPVKVYRLRITGENATIVGTTTLKAPQDRLRYQSWIKGKGIMGITYYHGRPELTLWAFPKGGNPSRQEELSLTGGGGLFEGITVSRVSSP